MKHLRFLLLQARKPNDPSLIEERQSFAQKFGVAEGQIASFDLLSGPPALDLIRRHDVLLMGGSGEFDVSKRNLPEFDGLLEVLAETVEVGHPTFASCFGFQLMVQALGGEIIPDPSNTQVGTFALELTDEGIVDPLLGILPKTFPGQVGRKDRAAQMPEGVPNLVTSELSPFMSLRIPDKPIWAFQFHPELDVVTNRQRFKTYMDGYARVISRAELERIMKDKFQESPDTPRLLPRFLELVFQ